MRNHVVRRLFGRLVLVLAIVLGLYFVVSHYRGGTGGCGITSGAAAHADSSDCASLRQVAVDPNWAARQQQRSELQNGELTTGLFFDQNSTQYIALSSGVDDLSARVTAILQAVGYHGIEPHPATHVETKIAAKMRDNGITFGVLVINNMNVCDDASSVGCRSVVAEILPQGSTLYVWTRGARLVQAFKGRGA